MNIGKLVIMEAVKHGWKTKKKELSKSNHKVPTAQVAEWSCAESWGYRTTKPTPPTSTK
ncbi:conserved hypothetical protein [Ricinus communis]|uniref:Uncharacterized protein n=1 Tax=Ricinus communis TaxID=3988 RepID=B9TBR7_RICCO|nr:conserved hypothetical protein [Ricinus communis]